MSARIFDVKNRAVWQEAISSATEALLHDKIVVYPTDTAYGFAAHALSLKAIETVYELKGRSCTSPMHIVVRNVSQACEFAEISPQQQQVLRAWFPGPITFVLKKRSPIPSLLVAGKNTIGIRIPDHPITKALSLSVPFPYTATSANLSGQPTVYSIDALARQFPGFPGIDVILDMGEIDRKSVV